MAIVAEGAISSSGFDYFYEQQKINNEDFLELGAGFCDRVISSFVKNS